MNSAIPKLASPFQRSIAFLIDFVVIMFLLKFTIIPFFLPKNWDIIPSQEILFHLFPIYIGTAFFCFFVKDALGGMSIGKRFMEIRICLIENELPVPSLKKLILRNILLILLPIEIFILLFDKHFRRWGDKITGTAVISRQASLNTRKISVKIIAAFLMVASLWTLYIAFSFIQIKKSALYQVSEKIVFNDPRVREKIGKIIEITSYPQMYFEDIFFIIETEVQGSYGKANARLSFIKSETNEYQLKNLKVIEKNL